MFTLHIVDGNCNGDDDGDGVVCSLFTLVMVDRLQTKSHFHLSIGQSNFLAPTGALYTIVRHDMSIQVPPPTHGR